MKRSVTCKSTRTKRLKTAGGFTLLELVIVMTIIAVVSVFAVLGINKSRNYVRLQNSARLFAGYAEKARMGAIRNHGATNIDITGPNTYTVTMDFDGTGAVPLPVRSFTLEQGVVFTDSTNTAYTVDASGNVNSSNGEAVSYADFNWRGRTAECSMLFRMQNSNNQRSTVQVAGSGDITIDTGIATPATLTTTAVSTTTDVSSSSIINGNVAHFELTPCGTAAGAGGAAVTPPPATCAAGSIGVDKSSYTIRRNGGSTATINVTVTGSGTITATPNANLSITPATRSVTSGSGGTFSFTVSSVTRVRASNPPFTVVFTNPCNSVTAYVVVNN